MVYLYVLAWYKIAYAIPCIQAGNKTEILWFIIMLFGFYKLVLVIVLLFVCLFVFDKKYFRINLVF